MWLLCVCVQEGWWEDNLRVVRDSGILDEKHQLEPRQFGNLHSTAVVGSGYKKVTITHRDWENASCSFGGVPDSHVSLSDDPNIGLLVYVKISDDCVQPIIIQQTYLIIIAHAKHY